jgi:nucleoside-diphosphate-sugar epimerase
MTSQQTVLLVGATGTMGSKIATVLAQKENVALRALVRSKTTQDDQKRQQLAQLEQLGVELVEGSLEDEASLNKACQNVRTVLSSVQGGAEVIVDGQLRLLEAAVRAGATRFLPSDFSGDYNGIEYGDNYNYDPRKRFAELAQGRGINVVHIMNGGFTEVFFAPFLRVFDLKQGTVDYWGTGNEPIDVTTMDDTAEYAAEAAIDPREVDTYFQVSGEVTTIKRMIADYETVTGQKLAERSKGTLDELKTWIETTKLNNPNPWTYLPEQYQWGLFTGKLKLTHLVNDRYPHIQPTSVRTWLTATRPDQSANIPYHNIPAQTV